MEVLEREHLEMVSRKWGLILLVCLWNQENSQVTVFGDNICDKGHLKKRPRSLPEGSFGEP